VLVAAVRAKDCATVRPFVEPLVATQRTKPDGGDPQQPLLYTMDEPDH
jgi:hypothetical protein